MTTEQNPSDKGGNVARIVDRLSKDISLMSTAHSGHPATNGSTQKVDALLRKAHQNQSKQQHQQHHSTGGKAVAVPTTASSSNSAPTQRHVVAYFSYAAQMSDELDLCEGDEITVLEDIEDGWARGKITTSTNADSRGRVGLFPTNFVGPPGQPQKRTSGAAATAANAGADGGSGGGASAKSSPPVGDGHAAAPKFKEMAKVLYKYDAANPDELTLPEGVLVTVLNKNCEDDGWFEGELNGQRGLFPENFVQLLPPVPVEGQPATSVTTPSSASTPVTVTSTEKSSPSSPGVSLIGETSVPPLQPPTLPAKPQKAGSTFGPKVATNATNSHHSSSSQPPTARFRDSMSAGPVHNRSVQRNETRVHFTEAISTTNLAPSKKVGEERKSMIAGLQSKLFGATGAPLGGFAPHKGAPIAKRDGSPSSVTTEPTNAAANEDIATIADETRLESVTKNRPKQVNKRPPSLGIQRLSLMQPKPAPKEPSSPSVIPSSSSATSIAEKPSSPGVPAKPPKGMLRSLASVSNDDSSSSPTARATPAKDGADMVRHQESDATEPFVSRAEFDAFRADANKRIEELQRQVAELGALLKTTTKC